MSISQLFIIAAIAFLVGQMKKGRPLTLLAISTFLIYCLQPIQENVTLTFWLPTATLIITVLSWMLTSTPEMRGWKQNWTPLIVLLSVVLLLDLNRYFNLDGIFITATPRLQWIGVLFIALLGLLVLIARVRHYPTFLYILAGGSLILIFILIKLPSVFSMLFGIISDWRSKAGGGTLSLTWLGFSYIAFRLLHTILDRKAGRLPAVPL